MHKRTIALALAAALLLALAGCGSFEQALSLRGDAEGYAFVTHRYESPIDLALYFEKYIKVRAEEFDLLLIGGDGMAARISGDSLDGCKLVYSREHAWELRSEHHPASARVKNIASIAVVSTSEDPRAARLVNQDETQSLTAGQLLLRDSLRTLREEGTNRLNNRSVTVYTTHTRVPLTEFFPEDERFCAMGFDGKAVYFRGAAGCFLESGGNRINLLLADGQIIEDLAGVMADPPGFMVTETANDALHFLARGERVLILELDGWGYAMQQRAGGEYAPFLDSLQPRRALACYPPISPAGLASMLTGETPDAHGIHDRENRELACEDLFAKAEKLGKTRAYIEGSHALLNTSITPELSLGDEETFANAREAMTYSPDLLFVHFHGIDEAAHEYGPYAERTLQKIKKIDSYARALAEEFDGRVIITADHGLHAAEDGGSHGQFLPEDMIVPYAIR